jgi:TDG/mug DNA glycosylase family protein
MKRSTKPTRADLLAAQDRTVRDVIAPGLRVLFCGINPGLYSGATGHHFARPGNRFWPTLHQAGFTPRLLDPSEERELLPLGYGITNLVPRATATADELAPEELVAGRRRLEAKVKHTSLGRSGAGHQCLPDGFCMKTATPYRSERLADATVWSCQSQQLNAHYQLANLVGILRTVVAVTKEKYANRE